MHESPDLNHVALRTNDTLEQTVEEVNGQQMGVKEKPMLGKLGREGDEEHRKFLLQIGPFMVSHQRNQHSHKTFLKEVFSAEKYTRRHSSHVLQAIHENKY